MKFLVDNALSPWVAEGWVCVVPGTMRSTFVIMACRRLTTR